MARRSDEKLMLSEEHIILSARLGAVNSQASLDVTTKLHHLMLRGRSHITPCSFDWDKMHRKVGQEPAAIPIGVLRITVLRAQGLVAADTSMLGSSTSDPYVKVTVGKRTQQTGHIVKSRNPTWTESNAFNFLVYSWDDTVHLEVLDYDLVTEDDHLGFVTPQTVSALVRRERPIEHTVQLGEGRGTLTFQTEWHDQPQDDQRMLSVVYATPPRDHTGKIGQDYALLEVCLNSITGLRSDTGVFYKLRVEVDTGDETDQIKPQKVRGFAPWRDPLEIEHQIDQIRKSMPGATNGRPQNIPFSLVKYRFAKFGSMHNCTYDVEPLMFDSCD